MGNFLDCRGCSHQQATESFPQEQEICFLSRGSGDGDEKDPETNGSVQSMVARLEDSAARLEATGGVESVKAELEKIEERLAKQQVQIVGDAMQEVRDMQLGLVSQIADFSSRLGSITDSTTPAAAQPEKAP